MQECGFDAPKTMDDVITIATTFAQKYGGYALPECQTLENFYRLALSWGAHPGIWVEQADGTLGYGTVQPEMKEALAQYAEWYKEGIVNPNFTTLNWDKMMQGMINGECGVIPFAQWFGYNPLPDLIKNQGPHAIFYPYEIPTQDGSPIQGSVSFNNNGYVVISKDCQNPEAVMVSHCPSPSAHRSLCWTPPGTHPADFPGRTPHPALPHRPASSVRYCRSDSLQDFALPRWDGSRTGR